MVMPPGAVPPSVVISQPGTPPGATPMPTAQPMPTGPMPPPGAAAAPATPGVKPLTRADSPKTTANPAELKVRPDGQGKVKFNFQGQPWLAVLEWLASISNLSLDWQEVPGDQLNLATQRSYTVEEARDLINRHLLDRGYTMLRNGEVLTVVNIKKLDPALVPRVRPEDLKKRDPHEFVKVSFPLEWLMADQAVEELKPMLSPNSKITALKTTNRVEAMDAVVNLREVYDVLLEEQSHDGQEQLVKEFQLEHIRAADVDKMLRELLGMPKAETGGGGAAAPGSPEQMMQMQQQMQQAMQQAQQQGGQPPGAAAGGADKKVHIVLNNRRNSVLVQAPADKMAIITQAVKTLDVPSHVGGSLMQALNNTKIYRMSAIDPEPFVKVLTEMGNLDPLTQIKVDRENNAIIVSGPLADHFVIMELLKKLDSSDRKFEVIRLRRLQADYVAGSIEFMMGAGEKKNNEMNPFMGYMPFGLDMGGGAKKDTKKFRVSADTENNRLLLWANELELGEINNLLAKLGETPSREGNPETLRVFELGSPEAAEKLLEKLRNVQPGLLPAKEAATKRQRPPVKSSSQQPEARQTPARGVSPSKAPQTQAEVAPRSGQGGRILRSGKPVPRVTFANLKDPTAEETAPPPVPVPRKRGLPVPQTKNRIQRSVEDHQAILPTFAPEQSDEESEPPMDANAEEPGEPEPPTEEVPSEGNNLRSGLPQRSAQPVQATVTEEGQLIIASPDTQSLDVLEDMIGRMAPPRRDFKIFHLKNRNTWAYGVVLNLEKFFGTEKDKGGGMKYSPYFGLYPSDKKDDGTRNLSKRRTPKFISDSDSHTILVTGADPEQLRVIQDLINIYDQPDVSDAKALRLTKIFQLKYSKARVIADAIKEVYRDLLSANDPALQQQQQNGKDQKPQAAERSYTYIYGNSDDSEKEPEAPIKFKGLLSLGVDEISNTVIVSSQEGLLENIGEMVDALDNAARPTQSAVQVLRVNRGIGASELQSRLQKILTRPQPPQPQPGQQQPQPGQPGQPMNPAVQQGAVAPANE